MINYGLKIMYENRNKVNIPVEPEQEWIHDLKIKRRFLLSDVYTYFFKKPSENEYRYKLRVTKYPSINGIPYIKVKLYKYDSYYGWNKLTYDYYIRTLEQIDDVNHILYMSLESYKRKLRLNIC